jgi:hypothetical protein
MKIVTWNLNNRVGTVRFRPEAAEAAIALGSDVIVFNEFFPQAHETRFRATLTAAGWHHQLMSPDSGEKANRVLIVSRIPLEPLPVALPTFDLQFSPNLLCAYLPTLGLSLVGVRIPAYVGSTASMILRSWDWVVETAASLRGTPSIILGDLNVSLNSPKSKGGEHFRRILDDGWHRALPVGTASYFGNGSVRSEIDHIIGTRQCTFGDAEYVQQIKEYAIAGLPNAISDHAALMCRVDI